MNILHEILDKNVTNNWTVQRKLLWRCKAHATELLSPYKIEVSQEISVQVMPEIEATQVIAEVSVSRSLIYLEQFPLPHGCLPTCITD